MDNSTVCLVIILGFILIFAVVFMFILHFFLDERKRRKLSTEEERSKYDEDHMVPLDISLKYVLTDLSTLSLIFSNIIAIVFAIIENWDLRTIMFIYWCQSVTIGVFYFFKILNLKNYSTENSGFTKKGSAACFFAFLFGWFHFTYIIYILFASGSLSEFKINVLNVFVVLTIILFFINHLYSYLHNKKIDEQKRRNLKTIVFSPILRTIPMHMTIVFGGIFLMVGMTQIALVIFLFLKTIIDVIMHLAEHNPKSKPHF